MTDVTAAPPRGAPGRVASVHRQARLTLAVAGAFTIGAPVTAALASHDGRWLGLHLFLVGGLLTAISGATQMLAVTWSAAPAPPDRLVATQRCLLAAGAVTMAGARHYDAPAWTVGLGAMAVVGALVLLAGLLLRIRAGAVTDRFHPAIDGYVLAIGLGLAGSALGIGMATDAISLATARDAHLALNLLGLVGLVVAATLPYFVATQVRMRQPARATPAAVRGVVAALALAVVVATIGHLAERPGIAAAGLGAYATVIVAVVALAPVPGRKQFAWAGPRIVQLGSGIAWWSVGAWALAIGQLTGTSDARAVAALAAGGYAQILAASLAYLGPVLRGGGHARLATGFAITRSWIGVVAANVAAAGALGGSQPALIAGLAVWGADALLRAIRLVRT